MDSSCTLSKCKEMLLLIASSRFSRSEIAALSRSLEYRCTMNQKKNMLGRMIVKIRIVTI